MTSKKKGSFDESKKNELSGFEEVLDLINGEKRKVENDQKQVGANPFELFNFLEREKVRLEKIDVLFRSKVPNLENNPISQKLCRIQEERLQISRMELSKKLSKKSSPLYKNLNDLFEKTFS
jgi:hypothetical protein